jgi:primosomal replication protein N
MMENINIVKLRGVLKEIDHSHDIDGVSFSKAKLICKRPNGQEDALNLKFKSFSNKYKENSEVELCGNIRSYSYKTDTDGNKVTIYVFTYFDAVEEELQSNNSVELTGRICKMNDLRKTRSGKHNVHFIIANNLVSNDNNKRLNSYIPCIAWGGIAKQISELPVNTKIGVRGELHSREHMKTHDDGNVEIRVAHELLVTSFEVLE